MHIRTAYRGATGQANLIIAVDYSVPPLVASIRILRTTNIPVADDSGVYFFTSILGGHIGTKIIGDIVFSKIGVDLRFAS